jgi:hypothetical protein
MLNEQKMYLVYGPCGNEGVALRLHRSLKIRERYPHVSTNFVRDAGSIPVMSVRACSLMVEH